MQEYELTLIFPLGLTEEKIDAIIKKLGVKVKSKQLWGRRVFSYPLKKRREGIYVWLKVAFKPEEVGELEKKLRLEEKVLRYLIVKS